MDMARGFADSRKTASHGVLVVVPRWIGLTFHSSRRDLASSFQRGIDARVNWFQYRPVVRKRNEQQRRQFIEQSGDGFDVDGQLHWGRRQRLQRQVVFAVQPGHRCGANAETHEDVSQGFEYHGPGTTC
jgi:hypothetical protein